MDRRSHGTAHGPSHVPAHRPAHGQVHGALCPTFGGQDLHKKHNHNKKDEFSYSGGILVDGSPSAIHFGATPTMVSVFSPAPACGKLIVYAFRPVFG